MQHIGEILCGHHGLAGVQALLVGELAQKMLRDLVYTLLERTNRARQPTVACHLQRAKFKPGRKLTAYYDVHLHDQDDAGACIRQGAVVWTHPGIADSLGQDDHTLFAQTLEADAVQRGLAAPFQRLVVSAPDWGMNLQLSPLDARYPHLVHLSDPYYICDLLAAQTGSQCPAGIGGAAQPARGYTVTPIRYRPGQRHVLRYDPVGATLVPGPGTMYAKLYENRGRPSFGAIANEVADCLAAYAPEVAALCPQAVIAKDNTILYPWVNGVPLSQLLHSSGRATGRHLEQTGTVLRALHAAQPITIQGLPTHDIATEIKSIARTCEHIQTLLPSVGQEIEGLLQLAQELYTALPQEAPTFIHGDFKADHVLVASPPRPALTLIDFDSCALADPSFDVGKFLADLDWAYAGTNQTGLVQAQNDFLTGYNVDRAHPRLWRARVIEALILIKITAHRLPLFDRAWATHTTALIRRARAILQRIEDDRGRAW